MEHLKSENRVLKEQNRMLTDELDSLRSHVKWLTRQVFGAKSEKSSHVLSNDCQLSLFGNASEEDIAAEHPQEEKREVKAHKRKKRMKPNIEELKNVLEVIPDVIPLEDDQKICPKCGHTMQHVGKELVRSELVREQPKVYIREIYRETYA